MAQQEGQSESTEMSNGNTRTCESRAWAGKQDWGDGGLGVQGKACGAGRGEASPPRSSSLLLWSLPEVLTRSPGESRISQLSIWIRPEGCRPGALPESGGCAWCGKESALRKGPCITLFPPGVPTKGWAGLALCKGKCINTQ